jgi:hypothetical protein
MRSSLRLSRLTLNTEETRVLNTAYRQRRPDESSKIAPTQPLGTPPQIGL